MNQTPSVPSLDQKVHFAGTHRTRSLEDTWRVLEPRLSRFGISRVADVTGLDSIGIPVAMAVRPLADSLSVSQGKGQTPLAARISAAMEAFEVWHAENACPPAVLIGVSGLELDLPYRVEQLVDPETSLVCSRTPLDWVAGQGLSTGEQHWVPRALIDFAHRPVSAYWNPCRISASSNGLASGNTVAEATVHALYELLERDALAGPLAGQHFPRLLVDASTVDDEAFNAVAAMLREAGVRIEINAITNRFGVPCFAAGVWSSDFPVWAVGAGAHSSPAVALSRAVTEAAQSRLTCIAGSRDDIEDVYSAFSENLLDVVEVQAGMSYRDVGGYWSTSDFSDAAAEMSWLAEAITTVTGTEPILVDLTTEPLLPVVRVVSPGLRFDPHMTMRGSTARQEVA
jgi:ribosomal protein S12 methylthiotransferase accessory factor